MKEYNWREERKKFQTWPKKEPVPTKEERPPSVNEVPPPEKDNKPTIPKRKKNWAGIVSFFLMLSLVVGGVLYYKTLPPSDPRPTPPVPAPAPDPDPAPQPTPPAPAPVPDPDPRPTPPVPAPDPDPQPTPPAPAPQPKPVPDLDCVQNINFLLLGGGSEDVFVTSADLELILSGGNPINPLKLNPALFSGYGELPVGYIAVFDREVLFSCNVLAKKFSRASCDDPDLTKRIHSNIARSAAYYKTVWDIDSFDGEGTPALIFFSWAKLESNNKLSAYNNACAISGVKPFLFAIGGNDQMTSLGTSAHESTHQVSTAFVKWSAYRGETGALNEGFSDIFGKFVCWAYHQEITGKERWMHGNRNMRNPNQSIGYDGNGLDGQPSYYLQRGYWCNTQDGYDNGGVHHNNGVLNRLCFLLCDGEDFERDDGRSFSVQPLGVDKTELLFGKLMFNSLTSDVKQTVMYYDIYPAMCDAATELGFSRADLKKIAVACDAVNIISGGNNNLTISESIRSKLQNNLLFADKKGNFSLDSSNCLRSFVASDGNTLTISGAKKGDMSNMLSAFVHNYAQELGVSDKRNSFTFNEENKTKHLYSAQQMFNGVPVYGATVRVRLTENSTVSYLSSSLASSLESHAFARKITAKEVPALVEKIRPGRKAEKIEEIIFVPELFGQKGSPCAALRVQVTDKGGLSEGQMFIDAEKGSELLWDTYWIVD